MNRLDIILLCDFILAFVLGIALEQVILRVSYKNRLFDMPGYRKVHELPIPRLGGVVFLPVLLLLSIISLAALYQMGILSSDLFQIKGVVRLSILILAASFLYVAGLVDDLSGLGSVVKFVIQILSALIIVSSGLYLHSFYGIAGIHEVPAWLGMAATVFIIVWIINAFNMIDGIDGLAGGLGIFSLFLLFVVYRHLRRFIFAMIAVVFLGAMLAFWTFNVFGRQEKHMKIFMGDAGSMTSGLVLSYLFIYLAFVGSGPNCEDNRIDLVFALSTMAIPMLEVGRLFFVRLRNHKSPFQADANHIHHQLLKAGLPAKHVLIVLLALDIVFVGCNILMAKTVNINLIILFNILLYAGIMYGIHRLIIRRSALLSEGQ